MSDLSLNRTQRIGIGIWQWVERGLNALFVPPQDTFSRWVSGLWLAGLLVLGVMLWGFFLGWGDIPFDFLDWAEVSGPRYALLRDAAQQRAFPWHVSNTTGLRGVTDRFLAIADTPLSPQFLLMPLFDLGRFVFLNTLLLYGIGFAGLVWIFRRYRLSPAAFTVLFLLFNFNGHIVSHLAVGHANWSGHFLLPFAALSVLALFDRPLDHTSLSWKWVLGFALLMLAILLQGGFHLFIWLLLFMGFLALAQPRLMKPILLSGLFAGLISLFRLLPPLTELGSMDPEFKNGFVSVFDLLRSLVVLRFPEQAFSELSILNLLGNWEHDTYIGLVGLAFLGGFGVYSLLKHDPEQPFGRGVLLIPILLVAILSLGTVYKLFIRVLPVPLLAGERVTSRFLIVPVVMLSVLAVLEFQRWLNRRRLSVRGSVAALAAVFLLGFDLQQHLKIWRIRYLDGLTNVFPKIPTDLSLHRVANHPDPLYTNLFFAGLVVSILALAFLVWMVLRERRETAK